MTVEFGITGSLATGYAHLSSATGTLGAHVVTVLTSATAIAVLKIAIVALAILTVCFLLYKSGLFTAAATVNNNKAKPQKSDADQFSEAKNQYNHLKETINIFKETESKMSEQPIDDQSIKNLHSELVVIRGQIKSLSQSATYFQTLYTQKIKLEGSNTEILNQYLKISEDYEKLNADYQELFNFAQSHVPLQIESKSPVGLQNTGGTCCYINSSLQPLLASKYFQNLIPDTITQYDGEEAEDFEGRNNILTSLKTFVAAWNNKETPYNLGKLIENLRTTMFEAGLQEGGFNDPSKKESLQDAGSFYELIFHVIEQKFELESVRSFDLSNGVKKMKENVPSGCLLLKSAGSIQEKITEFSKTYKDELEPENAYIVELTGERSTKFSEITKITSPPELLVVRVEHHKVNLDFDQFLDCSSLFEKKLADPIRYELVGFSQNHGQYHWTSVVTTGENWHKCNDGSTFQINDLNGSDFTFPANYLLYQRM